jgi:hypothetical protein
MKNRTAASALVIMALTSACAGDSPTSVSEQIEPSAAAVTGDECQNLTLPVDAVTGLWQFNGQTVYGGVPSTITLAGVTGQLGSIITGQSATGRAAHLTLVHVFISSAGTFLTEDRAICAQTSNDPTSCLINDDMRIVAGTGVFQDVSGFIHNTSRLDFVAGTLIGRAHGRICASAL